MVDSCGLGLRLGHQIRIFKEVNLDLNPFEDHEIHTQLVRPENGKFIIKPGEFVLCSSLEYVSLPEDLAARLLSRNSLNRLGIILVGTAGMIEPGFEGNLTFAIGNVSRTPVILYPEMHFCKLVFETLTSSAEVPYYKQKGSKYNKQKGPVASRLHLERNLKYFK